MYESLPEAWQRATDLEDAVDAIIDGWDSFGVSMDLDPGDYQSSYTAALEETSRQEVLGLIEAMIEEASA